MHPCIAVEVLKIFGAMRAINASTCASSATPIAAARPPVVRAISRPACSFPIRDHDPGASRREKVHATRADAARTSGDDDQIARKVEIHVVLVMQLVLTGPFIRAAARQEATPSTSPASGVNGAREL